MEGTPVQELAAIEVNRNNHAIVDVFLGHAYTEQDDTYAQQHIHGLNKNYLREVGFASQDALLDAFKTWFSQKTLCVGLYANDGQKESQALGFNVSNFKLERWAERKDCASHQIAIRYKELSIPVLNRACTQRAHSSYKRAPESSDFNTSIAKARHGYHCALYDVMELYFECLML